MMGRRKHLAAVTLLLLVLGGLALTIGVRGQAGPPQPLSAGASAGPATAAPAPADALLPSDGATTSSSTAQPAPPAPQFGTFVGAAAPTGLDIPSIGLHSDAIVGLDIGADGTLTPPETAEQVGWWTGGPTPGQLGPSVIGAHVDSKAGPGVFYRLGAMKAGDRFSVSRADGTTVTFLVDKVAVYPKDAFPTEEVYRGGFNRSEIRLITCGGTFDKVKHYLDNVVVFGHLDSVA